MFRCEICACMCAYTHTHTCTHIHTHTHVCTNKHAHAQSRMHKHTHTHTNPPPIHTHRIFGSFTMESILATAFGRKINVQRGEADELTTAAMKVFAFSRNIVVGGIVVALLSTYVVKVFCQNRKLKCYDNRCVCVYPLQVIFHGCWECCSILQRTVPWTKTGRSCILRR